MIIAAFNPKGGAGKTTTAVNVATVLAATGRSVLLIDLEADLNASISLGIRPGDARPSIADVLVHDQRAADAVRTGRLTASTTCT
jgi:chromosome partitioning protein